MKLLFVRHGETDWNVRKRIQGCTDIELNPVGITQAKQLGEKIASQRVPITRIYTSKLKRATKTAQIVGERIDISVEIIDGLEEMNLGQWEGMRWSEVIEQYPIEYQKWHSNRRYQKTPRGESYQGLLERMLPVLHSIIHKGEDKETVLIVTHSADIVSLLAMIHKTSFQDMFNKYHIGNADIVEIDSDEIERIQLV